MPIRESDWVGVLLVPIHQANELFADTVQKVGLLTDSAAAMPGETPVVAWIHITWDG